MPVFQNDCATSNGGTCHGSTTVTTQLQPRPYLGPFLEALDGGIIDQVYSGIVNVPSNEAPGMDYVVPGNPANSFLWHKVNGDLTSIASRCTNPISSTDPCGTQMPDQNTASGMQPPLDPTTQGMIANWIDAGAQNN